MVSAANVPSKLPTPWGQILSNPHNTDAETPGLLPNVPAKKSLFARQNTHFHCVFHKNVYAAH